MIQVVSKYITNQNKSGNTYVIVGRSKLMEDDDRAWLFHVKDLNTRENHNAESISNFRVDYDISYESLYHENLRKFRRKFRCHMLENIVRFLTCNRSFAEVKQLLIGREGFEIRAGSDNNVELSSKIPVSLKLYKDYETSLLIQIDDCLGVDAYCDGYTKDLTVSLSRDNDQAFWDPRIISLCPHK